MTIKIDFDQKQRADVEERMSGALGSYIQAMAEADPSKIDFSNWTPDEWSRFVQIGFDVSAIEIFKKRVTVLGPQETPPY